MSARRSKHENSNNFLPLPSFIKRDEGKEDREIPTERCLKYEEGLLWLDKNFLTVLLREVTSVSRLRLETLTQNKYGGMFSYVKGTKGLQSVKVTFWQSFCTDDISVTRCSTLLENATLRCCYYERTVQSRGHRCTVEMWFTSWYIKKMFYIYCGEKLRTLVINGKRRPNCQSELSRKHT